MSPLKDSKNNTIGQLLVFTDLTELKAFQSQQELRERLSTLGEMSAGIAHEMRNPLAVISGYTKLLWKKADDSIRPAVESIEKEVAVMDRIITDFLSFAKPTDLISA
jgi:signal transduction histidine kinase